MFCCIKKLLLYAIKLTNYKLRNAKLVFFGKNM